MAEQKKDSAIVLPSFPEYQAHCTGGNLHAEYGIRDLKSKHLRFGLGTSQMELILRISQDLNLLPFEALGTIGGLNDVEGRNAGTILSSTYFPSLAALIYYGFNQLAVRQNNEKTATLQTLHPRAQGVIDSTRTILASSPEIITGLQDPKITDNPGKELTLVAGRFDPLRYWSILSTPTRKPPPQAPTTGKTYGKVSHRLKLHHWF